ncbi:PepSY-associated TM helix domain-containing protein [Nonomuraea sp. NPDC050790]|uniref:PepSY-associated TM helix domain-containing protein n=1 Tax=Nonomuraea sp. NPDC050790 TaxID=3364371 RepID=UPI0037A502EB
MSSSTDVLDRAEQADPPPQRSAGWSALRPLVLRLHFYAGLLIAPFLLVAATTGLLYAASYQIERIVYAHELTAPPGGPNLPLERQVAAARAAHPKAPVTAVRPAAEPGETTRVLLDAPGLPASTQLAVFVDPSTAQVRGSLESYGSSGALPVRAWISHLHRNLHLGEPGRLYSELAASWLWVVALGGLLLWAGRRRRKGARLRRLTTPERGVTGRRRVLSWHGSIGLWAVVGLLFLAATGLTWSKYAGDNVDRLRVTLGWTTPSIATGGEHAAHTASPGGHRHGGGDVGPDQAVRAAAGRGLSGPLEIVWPGKAGEPYLVKESDKTWPQRLDQVAVDPATGQVRAELRFAGFPLAAKLTRWGIDGHQGLLFGLANQIVLMLLATGVITMIVLGYRMWWSRRPNLAGYPRGAWRGVNRAVLAAFVLVAGAVGYFMPLLGISLCAFLLLDVVLGRLLAGRRG